MHNVLSTEVARSAALERLWAVAAVLSGGMATGLAERGLTLARASLLWQLQRSGPSTQHALSRALRVTPRNVTGLVDALEADRLVSREPHPTDRRATLVTLTSEGAALARAMKRDQDGFAQVLFDGVSDADLAAFVRMLDQIVLGIRKTWTPEQ
jgi:DNA-binding MarR family transcriptional regulator